MTDDGGGPANEADPDLSADYALLAAIGAARSHVYISQHTLMNPSYAPGAPKYSQPLFDALAALIERERLIRIVISSPWRMLPALVDAEAVHEALTEHITDFLRNRGYGDGEKETLLCNLQVAPFVATGPIADNAFHSHAKYLQIDDQAVFHREYAQRPCPNPCRTVLASGGPGYLAARRIEGGSGFDGHRSRDYRSTGVAGRQRPGSHRRRLRLRGQPKGGGIRSTDLVSGRRLRRLFGRRMRIGGSGVLR